MFDVGPATGPVVAVGVTTGDDPHPFVTVRPSDRCKSGQQGPTDAATAGVATDDHADEPRRTSGALVIGERVVGVVEPDDSDDGAGLVVATSVTGRTSRPASRSVIATHASGVGSSYPHSVQRKAPACSMSSG